MTLTTAAPSPIGLRPGTSPLPRPHASRLARGVGALYILLAALGVVGPLTLQTLVVSGDPTATAANVAASPGRFSLALGAWVAIVVVDAAISVGLYLLLRHAGRGLTMLAVALRMVYTVVMAGLLVNLFEASRLLLGGTPTTAEMVRAQDALETFAAGFLVALVFFGLHLGLLSRPLCRSAYVPRVLAAFVLLAGVGYVVDSLAKLTVASYGGTLSAVLMAPAMLGEIGLALWLVIRGVRQSA